MKPRSLWIAFFAALAVVTMDLGLAAWCQYRALQTVTHDAQTTMASSRRLGRILQHQRHLPVGASATDATATGDSRLSGQEIVDQLRGMPEYAPFLRRQQRRRTIEEYGPWLEQLSLSPERKEELKRLLDARGAAISDAYTASKEAGLTAKQVSEVISRVHKAGSEPLREFLGSDDYASLSRYDKARSWSQNTVAELQDYLSERAIATLRPEQEIALADAYVASQWKWKEGMPPPGVLYRRMNDQIAGLSSAALDPDQREAMKAYFQFANTRSQLLGQLLHPQDPDGAAISTNYTGRR